MLRYHLDVATVVETLQRQKATGKLYAEIPPRLLFRWTPARAMINLSLGNVQLCSITSPSGELLFEGAHAQQELVRLGTLDWEWQEQMVPPPPPGADAGMLTNRRTSIPHKRGDIPPGLIERKSRSFHWALFLIDGKKSSEQIARLVQLPPQSVDVFFQSLEKEGYIFWSEIRSEE